MSFQSSDVSVRNGAPVEFYKFTGELGDYFYTNDNVERVYNGDTYLPENIARTAIELSSVLDSIVTVDINLPIINRLAMLYNFTKLPTFLDCEIFRWHRGTSLATDVKRIWSGKSVGFSAVDNTATISTQSLLQANLSASTNQVICQSQCNHRLYDSRCKVNPDDFKWTATVSLIRGTKIFVDNTHNEAHNLKLGKIVIDRTGENRIIYDNISTTIFVTYEFIDIVPGDTVTIFAGCDKAYSTCLNNFNNIPNFGGFKWLPIDNPYKNGF